MDMAEASFETRPKTIQVRNMILELSLAESTALKNLLNALPNPNPLIAGIKQVVNEALATAPEPP